MRYFIFLNVIHCSSGKKGATRVWGNSVKMSEQLENTLAQLLVPDNDVIQQVNFVLQSDVQHVLQTIENIRKYDTCFYTI